MASMVFWLAALLAAAVSYLLGSVSFAIVVSRLAGREDVRTHGSGNAGMTNVLRNYGKKLAFLTGLGDFSKGVLAVVLGRLIFSLLGVTAFDGGYVAGIFVLLGHLFPLYFGFKGGKGVLTSLGVVLVLNPVVFLMIAVLLVPTVFIVKIVSLTVLIGYGLFPVFTLLVDFFMRGLRGWPLALDFIFALCISGVGTFMHRANIKRLIAGTEYKFGQKKSGEAADYMDKK